MESVKIIPVMTPNYNNNLLKSICLFNSYKTNPNIRCSKYNSTILITIKDIYCVCANLNFSTPADFLFW